MPYISRGERKQYAKLLEDLAAMIPQDRLKRPGHMNYVVSLLINKVYGTTLRYADHNEILGVLTSIQSEFYRRNTAPYEDQKIIEEGDLTEV